MSTFAVASDEEVVPRVVGVNDAEERMSRPAEARDQMSFSGGMVPVEAHAAAHPGYMEAPIMLRRDEPRPSPLAPPGYVRPKGPDNNNISIEPHVPLPKPGHCGTPDDSRANTSCMPFPEPSIGQRAKTAVGKTWSIIEHFFGGEQPDVEPMRGGGGTRA